MEERDQSEFNMALSYLNRLNALFYSCDEASMEMDMYLWFHSLNALFRELSTEMKNKEIEELNQEIKTIFKNVNSHLTLQRTQPDKGTDPDLYWQLHKFELKLRKIIKESGLQHKIKEDARSVLK